MAAPIRDLSGQVFAALQVLSMSRHRQRGSVMWVCRCQCGNEFEVMGNRLTSGSQTSCGCQRLNRPQNKPKDMVGQKFGRLTILRRHGSTPDRKATWDALCDCGKFAVVSGKDVRLGHTKSCGCLNTGVKKHLVSHGMSNSREYRIWSGMVQRCTNPKLKSYPNYGGRGIRVCRRWLSFSNFFADMGLCPTGFTIERKNNDKGYMPSNCVWADRFEQAANRRPRRRKSQA